VAGARPLFPSLRPETVKEMPLADYRVVYFATHGLVAGDVKGLAEPSLALSIHFEPSEGDDGLLTASEVTQLRLNADCVVLFARFAIQQRGELQIRHARLNAGSAGSG
jgi:hypothetical protein